MVVPAINEVQVHGNELQPKKMGMQRPFAASPVAAYCPGAMTHAGMRFFWTAP